MKDFRNDGFMYFVAGCVVAFLIVQSLFFIVKAWKRGKELGIETQKMKDTIRSSVLFTFAPAISILATVFTLASALGICLPWIRLSVVGNLMYETVAANTVLGVMGGNLSSPVTDEQTFATISWAMTLGVAFSLVLVPIVCKSIHKKLGNLTSKSSVASKLGDILSAAAFIGIVSAFVSCSIAGKPKGNTAAGLMSVVTLIAAMIFTVALDLLCEKKKLKKLDNFVLPISMFGAMGVAMLLAQLYPAATSIVWR